MSLEAQAIVETNVTMSSLEKEYWSILVNHLGANASSKYSTSSSDCVPLHMLNGLFSEVEHGSKLEFLALYIKVSQFSVNRSFRDLCCSLVVYLRSIAVSQESTMSICFVVILTYRLPSSSFLDHFNHDPHYQLPTIRI